MKFAYFLFLSLNIVHCYQTLKLFTQNDSGNTVEMDENDYSILNHTNEEKELAFHEGMRCTQVKLDELDIWQSVNGEFPVSLTHVIVERLIVLRFSTKYIIFDCREDPISMIREIPPNMKFLSEDGSEITDFIHFVNQINEIEFKNLENCTELTIDDEVVWRKDETDGILQSVVYYHMEEVALTFPERGYRMVKTNGVWQLMGFWEKE